MQDMLPQVEPLIPVRRRYACALVFATFSFSQIK
jgi:hypothetical protein